MLNAPATAVPATPAASVTSRAPVDRLGRPLRDLRISVTDRCNFRCTYCMPREVFGRDHQFLEHAQLLTFEEIARLARIFTQLGVEKIRLTGGEPLVRRHLERLVTMLAALPGLDLALTTNGSLLASKAAALRAAGLQRITVSLDALDDRLFKQMSDADFPVARVLAGIEAATAAGFGPIKINMVVKRGVNDGEIVPLARYCREHGHTLRCIEYMDVGTTNGWRMDEVLAQDEILQRIAALWPLEALPARTPGEVARRWRYRDGGGEIGIVASVTGAFCRDCTRLRLSTDGRLYTCLFATHGTDLRALMRSEADDTQLVARIAGLWRAREDRYSELRAEQIAPLHKVEMSYIGG